MQIIRGQQPFPDRVTKSIFLLGPIPRTADTKHLSWKPEAYRMLEELGYDGVVYDPEWEENPGQRVVDYEYSKQIDWEVEAMNRADIIIAWIPRELPDMPAFSSNVEMGEFFKSGKLLLGYPAGTPKMGYITYRSSTWLRDVYKWQVPIFGDLKSMLQEALSRIGDGALRNGAEVTVPLDIWQDKSFQQWYFSLQLGKHQLDDLKVESVFYRRSHQDGRPKRRVWMVRPKVRVAEENRFKDNEVVIGRPATVSVLMYYPQGRLVLDWQVVLIREYRPAVMNFKGMVYELPGGSIEPLNGPFDERAILGSALREVEEETGLALDASCLYEVDVRQAMATLVACENHLYAYQLNREELAVIAEAGEAKQNSSVGDNDEFTLPVLVKISELMSAKHSAFPLDWVNMGMIMKFTAQQQAEVINHLESIFLD